MNKQEDMSRNVKCNCMITEISQHDGLICYRCYAVKNEIAEACQ